MEYTNKDQPPAFLLKTYMMVDDPSTDGTVSWNIDGTGFVVWRLAEFARDLLPTIFKHGNFASFIRQLNTYGFHKLSPDRWEFENKLFCRGQIDQLHKICRKKQTPNKPRHDVQLPKAPSRFQFCDNGGVRGGGHVPSTSSQYTILVDENRKLQQENTILNSELSVVKKRFDKLLDLATIYGRNSNEVKSNSVGPKIFGVRLNAGERADMEN